MPGAANSFSFRTRSYRISRLSDISLDGDEIVLTGIFMDSVLMPLGDVDFETLALSSPGISSLKLLKPSQSFEQLDDFEKRYRNEKDEDGFQYLRRAKVKVGALMLIAESLIVDVFYGLQAGLHIMSWILINDVTLLSFSMFWSRIRMEV